MTVMGGQSLALFPTVRSQPMGLLVFILIVLVVLVLAIYATRLLPPINGNILRLIQLVLVVIAIVVIVQRAGLV
jgi:hypothetical protein